MNLHLHGRFAGHNLDFSVHKSANEKLRPEPGPPPGSPALRPQDRRQIFSEDPDDRGFFGRRADDGVGGEAG